MTLAGMDGRNKGLGGWGGGAAPTHLQMHNPPLLIINYNYNYNYNYYYYYYYYFRKVQKARNHRVRIEEARKPTSHKAKKAKKPKSQKAKKPRSQKAKKPKSQKPEQRTERRQKSNRW